MMLVSGAAVAGLAGCAKMDQALDKQWMQVDFGPNTSITGRAGSGRATKASTLAALIATMMQT